MTPAIFASHLLADMQLPAITHQHFTKEIINQINDHLSDSRAIAWETNVLSAARAEHRPVAEQAQQDWRRHAAKRRKLKHPSAVDVETALNEHTRWPAQQLEEAIEWKSHDELRIHIKLDITVAAMNLVDQIEWDLSDPSNSPEDFARQLAIDLGLPGEFESAIAHSIREQTEAYMKSLSLIEHRPGALVVHDELKTAFLLPLPSSAGVFVPIIPLPPIVAPSQPAATANGLQAEPSLPVIPSPAPAAPAPAPASTLPHVVGQFNMTPAAALESVLRVNAAIPAFTPRLEFLTADEVEQADKLHERETRRKRRQTRGRARVTLPDREPVRTHRTLMPIPGGKEPQPYTNKEGEMVGFTAPAVARPYPFAMDANLPVAPKYKAAASEKLEDLVVRGQVVPAEALGASSGGASGDSAQKRKPKGRKPNAKPVVLGKSTLSESVTAANLAAAAPVASTSAEPSITLKIGSKKQRSASFSGISPESVGQHAFSINGKWHCANCGGPDGVVMGKRKGPAGEKSLCAACGAFSSALSSALPSLMSLVR